MLRHASRRLSVHKAVALAAPTTDIHSVQGCQCIQGQANSSNLQQIRGASKKQGGSTQNGKDSNPKMLGVKLFGGQQCIPGNIIIRQRGTKFHPGANVGLGKDHTIFATAAGKVKFHYHKLTKRRFVGVQP
ncbi:hypothetical protein WJX84_009276 [Apatococcus fuscideae]|uniref:Ribosomal protein L27 n=1 Tax=Apatococcus fuscideae TaxID=2026836 RepID=A0AAW1SKY3_9CHLO